MKKDLFNLIKIIGLGVIVSVGAVYISAQTWTPGGNNPPFGQADAPINTSITPQKKGSGLGSGALLDIMGNLSSNSLNVFGTTVLQTGDLTMGGLAVATVPTSLCAEETGKIIKCPPPPVPTVPTVDTLAVTSFTQTTATGGGNVTAINGSPLTERGIAWGTGNLPTISGTHASSGSASGIYYDSITGLDPDTLYYVRAYAINSSGPSYGLPTSFRTKLSDPTLLVTVSGAINSKVTSNVAGTNGQIINCGSVCNISFLRDTVVTLTANTSANEYFTGWTGGGCSGVAPCVVTMSSQKNVAANFMSCNGWAYNGYCWYEENEPGGSAGISCDQTCASVGASCVSNRQNGTKDDVVMAHFGIGSLSPTFTNSTLVMQQNGSQGYSRYTSGHTPVTLDSSCSATRSWWKYICSCSK